ncbi:MAG: hypothetical protein ACXVXC_07635 [Nocardioidaceae bacterium]
MPTKSTTFSSRAAATAVILAAAVAPLAASAPASAAAPTHLTAHDAEAALGSWGLDAWRTAHALPRALRWAHSCSTGIEGADRAVLRDHDDAGIRSGVAVLPDPQTARRDGRRAAHRVATCQAGYPALDRIVTDLRVRTDNGTARAYGTVVGSSQRAHAMKVEYVIVGRSRRAAEVTTFRCLAQEVLPRKALRSLVRHSLRRLANAG